MLWPVFLIYAYKLICNVCFHLFAGGDDYVSGLIMATLTNTTREVCLIVPTIADDLAEPAETFTVVMNIITVFIDSPDSCVVIGRSNSTGTIRDAASKSDCQVKINATGHHSHSLEQLHKYISMYTSV